MNGQQLIRFMKRPEIYVGIPTFERAFVYLNGLHDGSNGTTLLGFREWLFTRMGDRQSANWVSAVVEDAMKQYSRVFEPNNSEDDKILMKHLFQLLQEYLAEREQPDGLKRIFVRYQRMIEASDGFVAERDAVD